MELESRRSKGFPAIVIHSESKCKRLSDLLTDIDHCIAHRDINNAPILYKVENETQNFGWYLLTDSISF